MTPHHWRDVLSGSQLSSEGWYGTLRTQSTLTSILKILRSFPKAEEEILQWAGEIQNTKTYPGVWQIPNRFDPQYATGICSFPLCCYSTMNHNKGWEIQVRESSQWDSHSLQSKGRFFSPEYRRDSPSLEQTEGCINIYHPNPIFIRRRSQSLSISNEK